MSQEQTIGRVGLLLTLLSSLSACGGGGMDESEQGLPAPSTLTYKVDHYRPDFSHSTKSSSYQCTDADEVEHGVEVYQFKNATIPEVPLEERGLWRSVFFWTDASQAFAVIDGHGALSYKYQGCDFTWLLQMRDFSERRLRFNPAQRTHEEDNTRPPMEELSPLGLQQNAAEFNGAIVDFIVERMDTRVGDGECWTLASRAIKAAGAHEPVAYIFGSKLGVGTPSSHEPLGEAVPGDIVQFDAGRFEYENGGSAQAGQPVHTAIVKSVNNHAIEVYEQNAPVGGPVRSHTYDFDAMTSGLYIVYRAYPLLPSSADD